MSTKLTFDFLELDITSHNFRLHALVYFNLRKKSFIKSVTLNKLSYIQSGFLNVVC